MDALVPVSLRKITGLTSQTSGIDSSNSGECQRSISTTSNVTKNNIIRIVTEPGNVEGDPQMKKKDTFNTKEALADPNLVSITFVFFATFLLCMLQLIYRNG